MDLKSYRFADPHIGVDVVAVDDPALADGLLRAELLLEAAVVFGQGVVTAVLPAGAVWVHVHLVFHVSLEQSGHLLVGFTWNMHKQMFH